MPRFNDILTTTETRIVLLLTILAVLSAVGWYFVARCRDEIKDDESTGELMAEFCELHHRGHLTSAEYRTIKSLLADKSLLAEARQDEPGDARKSN